MPPRTLRLILGDQLSANLPTLRDADPALDVLLMAEVREEATYVPHNRHKLVLIFSAMRHFADSLRDQGFALIYRSMGEEVQSLESALEDALRVTGAKSIVVTEPGEYRLAQAIASWSGKLGATIEVRDDSRFLASKDDFANWAAGKKQLRMEYFYREMRRRYGLLMTDDGKPEGAKWNFDADNRKGWRSQQPVPERIAAAIDEQTQAVIQQVEEIFPDNPGDLSRFSFAVTAVDAELQFDNFCENALADFGSYQDALAEESPWMFHSLVSMYLNIGLLDPLQVCRRIEKEWREGNCSIAAAEGFIRQVLGWREYVRGLYWFAMPEYAKRNTFDTASPLPDWFWTADTDMRCLHRALKQSLDLGYAHHIQRLMVVGNFALLSGLNVAEVCEWYLAVYVDAFEWVELPNTLGMALHGDNGLMASKPYAASGKYIQRQGDHCQQCRYDPNKTTGDNACPYNGLYWRFIDRHQDYLKGNARMGLIVRNWEKRAEEDRQAILSWADKEVVRLIH